MRFAISRTSEQFAEPAPTPCKGAYRVDGDAERWFIDFSSLEDLMAFANTHGLLVLIPPRKGVAYPELEIYDGYRE